MNRGGDKSSLKKWIDYVSDSDTILHNSTSHFNSTYTNTFNTIPKDTEDSVKV